MTFAEAGLLRTQTDRPLWWAQGTRPELVELRSASGRCPLLTDEGRCSVYAARPYNCRRFACLREPGEALEPGGPVGCANAERRLESRPHRRLLAQMQRDAQRWARAHGWDEAWT